MIFEVRPFEARTASWWFRNRETIDFDPPYQRSGPAWDKERQAYLIDTMLNDFDMPKLYLADFTYFPSSLNRSGKRFAIIDGKQRLSAIFGFFDGSVALANDFVLRADPDAPAAGLTYEQLDDYYPELRVKFDNFNLPVMSVISDEEQLVNELFVRLNSGKPLTSAERRNAMNGVVPELVRQIANTIFFQSCVSFTNSGRAHDQAAAKLLLLEWSNRPVDLKKRQLDGLFDSGTLSQNEADLNSATNTVLETLAGMSQVFMQRDPLLRTQGQIPVYYTFFREESYGMSPSLRPIIQGFSDLRREVRAAGRVADAEPNSVFLETDFELAVEYNYRLRNPNDYRSVLEMSRMLSEYVARHV
ncbi:MAG: DUF262 domain-containing protein [Rhodospirillales bacterium]|nr:DUF262 domain-containing protein [Acetobacter sp.]